MKRYISIEEKYKTKYIKNENGDNIPERYDDEEEKEEDTCVDSKKKK